MKEKSLFAQRLTDRRIKLKFTQESFANLVGMSRARYANYEQSRREPDFEIAKLFAEHLKTTTDYLLGYDDYDRRPTTPPRHNKPKDLLKFLDESEVMFDGVPLTEEDKEKVRKALELAFWDAKQQNKRKKS
ncbi:hypothetical protein SDC9_04177 [bioreactor metagenome]|uniref:HTH cro/C1-type domain-containing protein n=1 Tax=bioreactor metagenome TaxID=1076179 RepID=A0A644SVK5_9ZZZZ|nr:helix-turn-helix transcriptional regulator [Negativicutes bacterium]